MINKKEIYEYIEKKVIKLFEKTENRYARMTTLCALLYEKLDYFFWTGFYLIEKDELVVAAYQGPLAGLTLPKNRGVCWAAVNRKKTIVVPDVDEFEGHISCDARSRSEIVVPLFKNKEIIGVLDIDSEKLNSFDKIDQVFLEKLVNYI